MDDDEMKQVKFYLGLCVFFLMSMWYSWQEVKYAVWGETSSATVTEVREASSGRRGRRVLQVSFRYSDADGHSVSEAQMLPLSTVLSEGEEITVEYLPGAEDSARVEGTANLFAVYIFLGSLLVMAFVGFRIWKMAHDAVHGSGRRRR